MKFDYLMRFDFQFCTAKNDKVCLHSKFTIDKGHPIGLNSNCGGGSSRKIVAFTDSRLRLSECVFMKIQIRTKFCVSVCVCADKYCSYSKLSVILHTHAHTHHVLGDFDTGWVSMRRSTQNYYLIGQQLLVFTQKPFHNHAFGSLQLIYHHYFSFSIAISR